MIINSVIRGNSGGGVSDGDFVLSALSSLGSGYTGLDGTRVTDDATLKKIVDDSIGRGVYNLTPYVDYYPASGSVYTIGDYLDDDILIETYETSDNSNRIAVVWSRSGDSFTRIGTTTISNSAGYDALSRIRPFKFGSYYVFPSVHIDQSSDYNDIIYSLFYTADGSTWSRRQIWSGRIYDSSGDNRNFDCVTDGIYIYCILKNATSLRTYRLSSLSSTPEDETYTVVQTSNSRARICSDGSWVCGARYYCTSWDGTPVDLGTSTALGTPQSLYKIDNQYWLVTASGANVVVKIADTMAGLLSVNPTLTIGNVADHYAKWEHGLYRLLQISSGEGPTIEVLTKTGSVYTTCDDYVDTSTNFRSKLVYHYGVPGGILHAHSLYNSAIKGGGSIGDAVVLMYVGLEDMSEPRYKVKQIGSIQASVGGGNADRIIFEDIDVLPYALFFYDSTYISNSGHLLGGIIFPETATGFVFVRGNSTVEPSITLTGTKVVVVMPSGVYVGGESFVSYAVYKDVIPDTYKTFMKL